LVEIEKEINMPFDAAGRAFHDGRKPSSRLPFWATPEEIAEVERLDVARKELAAERGATIDNGYDSNQPMSKAERDLLVQIGALMRAIEARKGVEPKSAPMPDLKTAKAFWSALSPNDPAIRLRFLKHDRSAPPHEVYANSIEAVWPKVVELQTAGYEAYYFLNAIPPGNGRG
jgi:hypothetical protein